MPKLSLLLLVQLICCALTAQRFSVANERQNIFYIGVDNPVSIAVENIANKNLIVKTDNGTIKRGDGGYVYNGGRVGRADIILYKKLNGKLKEIGRSAFRVKNFSPPTFKIGPYRTSSTVEKNVIKSQQYVRAELENSDFDATFLIDSFMVCIVRRDTCVYFQKANIGNKISTEIHEGLESLKPGDTIIFKKIFAKAWDGNSIQLEPCILFVKEE